MSRQIRMMLLIFASVSIGSYIYILKYKATTIYHLKKIEQVEREDEEIHKETEQENCQLVIAAYFCTAPVDRSDHLTCSERLAENHCDKYIDTGDLIYDEDRAKFDSPREEDWRIKMIKDGLRRHK